MFEINFIVSGGETVAQLKESLGICRSALMACDALRLYRFADRKMVTCSSTSNQEWILWSDGGKSSLPLRDSDAVPKGAIVIC